MLKTGKNLICIECNNTFYVSGCRLNKAKFCSVFCKTAYNRKNKIELSCLNCNAIFEVFLSEIDRKFCNKKCSIEGQVPWNKDRKNVYTEEAKKKMSESHMGKKHTEETKIKLGNIHRGRIVTEETKQKMRNNHPDFSGKNSPMYGKRHSDKTKALMRIKGKARFHDPVYLKNYQDGMNNSPNKLEQKMQFILDDLFPNKWKFTGDMDIVFNGKSPDFFYVGMDKCRLIEVFGNYWHSEKVIGKPEDEYVKDRIDHFKEYGFDTLVIWENDIKNNLDEVKSVIKDFTAHV